MDYIQIKEILEKAERKAAEVMLSAEFITANDKSGSRDVVTEFDAKVQVMMQTELKKEIPDAEFFCEELGQQSRPDVGKTFVIDPIDGTMNFYKGFKRSCISAAYAEDGDVKVGAIYNPYTDEMFCAVKGEGAWLNGKLFIMSDTPLKDSVVCMGTSPYYPELWDKTFSTARAVMEKSLDIRREGSAALDLCSAAAGRAGLYFEMRLSLWDYAAGMLIVKEAGGMVKDMEGNELPFDGSKTSIAAGSRAAVTEFIEIMH